ncbi:MAG: GDP-mannose 4,6-dehydratase [Elusimicrobia bacterium]|nr:GDP-mannose 4,6-dehydratase [Elusimicrobiota bacterium]
MKILITGGAGFIGSHLADNCLESGHKVVLLDNLDPQVHGEGGAKAARIQGADFIHGDVTDPKAMLKALDGVDAVAHLAATVGVGQSMYEVVYYTHANVTGTACLYQTIIKNRLPVKKIVVASSMSAYGEGLYRCERCAKNVRGQMRPEQRLKSGLWELECPQCHGALKPVGTPETEMFHCESIYALSKRDTEEIAIMLGRSHNLPTVALRFFNVFGTGQSLSNPYTGVAAIFFSRILNERSPVIYEDGLQSRDFIHVRDVARAVRLSLESPVKDRVFNVGRGQAVTIAQVADLALKAAGRKGRIAADINGAYRTGDVRHCFADAQAIRRELRWEPRVSLEEGFEELYAWAKQSQAHDHFDRAAEELKRYGLVKPAGKTSPKASV